MRLASHRRHGRPIGAPAGDAIAAGEAAGLLADLDDAPAPPGWWAAAFGRRQRRLRVLVIRHLRAAARAGRPEKTTAEIGQCVTNYERAELEHCLADLDGDGLVRCELRREPKSDPRSAPVDRAYWHLAGASP